VREVLREVFKVVLVAPDRVVDFAFEPRAKDGFGGVLSAGSDGQGCRQQRACVSPSH
jgi:hypothetical protein